MRGNIIGRRIPNPISNSLPKSAFLLSSSSFSTSSGRGGGRGGGGGKFDFVSRAPGKPEYDDSKPVSPPEPQPQSNGIGRGRAGDFASFISSLRTSKPGIGRGRGSDEPPRSRPPPPQPQPQPQPQPHSIPPQTQFTQSIGLILPSRDSDEPERSRLPQPQPQPQSVPPNTQFAQSSEQNLPPPRHVPQSGIGRGKPGADAAPTPTPRLTEENRHVRRARPNPGGEEGEAKVKAKERPKINREEAVRRAVSILNKGGGDGYGGRGDGSGQGRGMGRGRGRGGFDQSGDFGEPYDGLVLGDDADGEKLAERIGAENMQLLIEGFEDLSDRVLPSPEQDAYVDALHTNYSIEFEPEYLMGEFDQNPDIDEKPPMPIREMLEKVKPFIMAYEGIQSQEEWEEVVEETMRRVPMLKEIVDHYSGPDRITAKRQQEELERVAKTIPPSAPASVKQFTDRAVLSLQSNPGWGFDKKCQFMDKLTREVNQCYN